MHNLDIINKSEVLKGQFDEDGFLILPGFFDRTEITEIRNQIDRVITDVVPNMPRSLVYLEDKEDSTTIKQLQKLNEHDAWCAELMDCGPVQALSKVLLGAKVTSINMQYFNEYRKNKRPIRGYSTLYVRNTATPYRG